MAVPNTALIDVIVALSLFIYLFGIYLNSKIWMLFFYLSVYSNILSFSFLPIGEGLMHI